MMHTVVAQYMEMLLLTWLAAIAFLVLYRMLSGGIRLDGLLASAPNGPVSPERMQLMIASMIAVGGYVLTTFAAMENSTQSLSALPDVPTELIVLFGGSQTFYLMGKFIRAAP